MSRVSLSVWTFTFTPELSLMEMFNSGKAATIDDVCRFLMAHTLVLSYSTFTSMAFLLVKLLQFKYRQHYTVNPFGAQVIHNILGKLFKGIWHKRTRIWRHIVRKILTGLLVSASRNDAMGPNSHVCNCLCPSACPWLQVWRNRSKQRL